MPTYSYINTETKEEFELSMTVSEMEQYEMDNPNVQRIYHKIGIVDPVNIGVTRPPSDFQKFVLGRVKDSVPGAKVENRWNIKREV